MCQVRAGSCSIDSVESGVRVSDVTRGNVSHFRFICRSDVQGVPTLRQINRICLLDRPGASNSSEAQGALKTGLNRSGKSGRWEDGVLHSAEDARASGALEWG